MVGVLEHLRDLDAAVRRICARSCRPAGLLYVEVPDVTAFADWPNAPYQDFSTEHINFFSPISLEQPDAQARLHASVPRAEPSRAELPNGDVEHVGGLSEGGRVARRPACRSTPTRRRARTVSRRNARTTTPASRAQIDAVVDAGRPILVWGVGTHTSRLMATSRLAEADIVAFIESNSRYHGKTLHGRPILAPEALQEHQRAGADQLARVPEGNRRTDPPRPRMPERADPALQCLTSAHDHGPDALLTTRRRTSTRCTSAFARCSSPRRVHLRAPLHRQRVDRRDGRDPAGHRGARPATSRSSSTRATSATSARRTTRCCSAAATRSSAWRPTSRIRRS